MIALLFTGFVACLVVGASKAVIWTWILKCFGELECPLLKLNWYSSRSSNSHPLSPPSSPLPPNISNGQSHTSVDEHRDRIRIVNGGRHQRVPPSTCTSRGLNGGDGDESHKKYGKSKIINLVKSMHLVQYPLSSHLAHSTAHPFLSSSRRLDGEAWM